MRWFNCVVNSEGVFSLKEARFFIGANLNGVFGAKKEFFYFVLTKTS